MAEDQQPSSGGVELTPPAPNLFTKYLPWVAVALLLAVLSWLVPSYRKVVKDNETLTSEKQDLQQKLDVASKTKVTSRTYYPTGTLASETSSETDTDTISVSVNSSSSSSDARSHQETVTKRGSFVLMAYTDLSLKPAFSASYQFLGPVNVGVAFAGGPYLGLGLSF